MEKTAKEWFSEFPEPYRTQALKNLKEKGADKIYSSASAALNAFNSFGWYGSPEGVEYWDNFHNQLKSEGK